MHTLSSLDKYNPRFWQINFGLQPKMCPNWGPACLITGGPGNVSKGKQGTTQTLSARTLTHAIHRYASSRNTADKQTSPQDVILFNEWKNRDITRNDISEPAQLSESIIIILTSLPFTISLKLFPICCFKWWGHQSELVAIYKLCVANLATEKGQNGQKDIKVSSKSLFLSQK